MLQIENLQKYFQGHDGQTVKAVDDVSITIQTGHLFTLLGPSGCGKTTTLRSIAGLERPNGGRIRIDDQVLFDSSANVFVPPNERGIGMVFQSYAIWPHMTVFDNVAFPLRQIRPRLPKQEIRARVKEALETVHMGGYEQRGATQLSGGQQQRLALARALVHRPKLLLLDEPLSNLDAKLRERMRAEIKKLQMELKITTVYVTHDQIEALALSDEIVVMNGGKVIQQGTPRDIYQRPANRFVADFIGTANFLKGTVAGKPDPERSFQKVKGVSRELTCASYRPFPEGTEVIVSIRPENIAIALEEPPAREEANRLKGHISFKTFLGEYIDYSVEIGEGEVVKVRTHPDLDLEIGREIHLVIPCEKCVIIPA